MKYDGFIVFIKIPSNCKGKTSVLTNGLCRNIFSNIANERKKNPGINRNNVNSLYTIAQSKLYEPKNPLYPIVVLI